MKYEIIYADPPWHFHVGERQKYDGKRFRNLSAVYPTMTESQLRALDVKSICEDNAVLCMWTTDAHMPQALAVGAAWGFQYKTVLFIWRKVSKHGTPLATVGPWSMKNCEQLLLFTRGSVRAFKETNNMQQLVEAERTEHSKKPKLFADKIVELFGDRPRVELFARDRKPGWAVFGNEVKRSIGIKAKAGAVKAGAKVSTPRRP